MSNESQDILNRRITAAFLGNLDDFERSVLWMILNDERLPGYAKLLLETHYKENKSNQFGYYNAHIS